MEIKAMLNKIEDYASEYSDDTITQVGAAIEYNDETIITCNKKLPHLKNNCWDDRSRNLYFIHAEDALLATLQQKISSATATDWDVIGHMLYITHFPCAECAKKIVLFNIRNKRQIISVIVYKDVVKDSDRSYSRDGRDPNDAIKILHSNGIDILEEKYDRT